MEQFSNAAFWDRHPMPYFKIPRTEKYGMRCATQMVALSQRILHYLQRDTGMRHFMDGDHRDGDYDDGEDESDDFAEGSGFIE